MVSTVLPNCAAALRYHIQLAHCIHPSIDLWLIVGFSLSTQGTGVCPAGSVSVDTEAACISAAAALGYSYVWSSVHWSSLDPKGGCYHRTNGKVHFNNHPAGHIADPDTSAVCSGNCSGLCLFAYMPRVRECTYVIVSITVSIQ